MGLSETRILGPPPKLQGSPVIAWVTVLPREKERPQAKTWVHDAEQTEPGVKPKIRIKLLFHYQGYAAHGWRIREDLQQMYLGNLHGLVSRREEELLLTKRGVWMSVKRWYRKVESSYTFFYFVPSLHFTINQDCMTVPAVRTEQTWNMYLPMPTAWTGEMWCTDWASHQRPGILCQGTQKKQQRKENMDRGKGSGKAQNASNY